MAIYDVEPLPLHRSRRHPNRADVECPGNSRFEENTLIVSELGGRFVSAKGTFDAIHYISGVDLMPTILDYAGSDEPDGVQGEAFCDGGSA